MEILAILKVNDMETGELLERVDACFTCDECESMENFGEEHGEAVREFLENKLEYDYSEGGVVMRLDIIPLADDFDGDDE